MKALLLTTGAALLSLTLLQGCATSRPMIQNHRPATVTQQNAPEYQTKLWSVAHWQAGAKSAAKQLAPNIKGPVAIKYTEDEQEPSEFLRGYRTFLTNALISSGVQVVASNQPATAAKSTLYISSRTVWHQGSFDNVALAPVTSALAGGLVAHTIDGGTSFWTGAAGGLTVGAMATGAFVTNPVNFFGSLGYSIRHLVTGNESGSAKSTSGETYVVNELAVDGLLTVGHVEVMYIPFADRKLYANGHSSSFIKLAK